MSETAVERRLREMAADWRQAQFPGKAAADDAGREAIALLGLRLLRKPPASPGPTPCGGGPPAAVAPPAEGSPLPLEHTRSCGALTGRDCTCGLAWRIRLVTEQEMHAAWRKRAEEAEAREAGAPPALVAWQPIASAPKDGHAVIGLTWNREVFVVFWSHFYNTWRHADDGWCSGSAPRLTHWMPLPDAPTETTR